MRRFAFSVPSVPTRALSPNASNRMHWGTKAKARDRMAHDWGWAIKESLAGDGIWYADRLTPVFDSPVSCQIAVYWPPHRKGMDGDNLLACFKKGIDQLQEQGIVANDRQISFLPIVQERDPEKKGRVEVVIEG